MAQEHAELSQHEAGRIEEKARDNSIAATPPVDIFENDEEILLVADLPGVPAENLEIDLDGSELRVKGLQLPEVSLTGKPSAFLRTFRVTKSIDPRGVTAKLKHGVLHLHLKKSETAKPRKIPVQSN